MFGVEAPDTWEVSKVDLLHTNYHLANERPYFVMPFNIVKFELIIHLPFMYMYAAVQF